MLMHFFVHTRFIIMVLLLISTTLPQNASALFWYSPPVGFVSPPNGRSFDLSVDPFGNAFTAYTDTNGVAAVTRFSNANEAYDPPFTLATSINIPSITVATGVTGTAVCVWPNATLNELQSAYYNGSSWTVLSPPVFTLECLNPDVQMNSSGNALLTWENTTFSPPAIYVSFFNGGTQTWSTPFLIGIGATGGTTPKAAFNNAGDGMVVWRDIGDQLLSSYYNSTLLFWNGPNVIGTNILIDSQSVGIDSAGNAIAVWADQFTSFVYSNYYNRTLNLFFPQVLSIVSGGVPSLGMTPSGNAFVGWTDGFSGFYNEFRIATSTWTGAATLPVGTGEELKVGVDSTGNALVAFLSSGNINTMSIYKPFNGAFQAPTVAISNPNQVNRFLAALSDSGRGFIDGFYNGSSGISGTFSITDINGNACFDLNGNRVRFLSWAPSRDPDVVAYHLKRNNTLIAVNLATQPRIYVDENRNADITDVYTVIAVDASGNEISKRRIALK